MKNNTTSTTGHQCLFIAGGPYSNGEYHSFATVAARAGAVGSTLAVGIVLRNIIKVAPLGLNGHKAVTVSLLGAVGLVSAVAVAAVGRHGCT